MKIRCLPVFLLSFLFFSKNTIGQTTEGVHVSVKVFLQGALIGTPDGKNTMRDDLRSKNLLPVSEPYSGMNRYEHTGPGGAEMIAAPSVFQVAGKDAIVDWIYLELRSPNNPSTVVATRSALLQKDGDVVDMDGASPVFFEEQEPGEYFVAIRHRNHLGVMAAEAILLSEAAVKIDFSSPGFLTYGDYAQVPIGAVMAMWAGDANQDGIFILQGPENDTFYMFSQILSDPANTEGNVNHIVEGYLLSDIDLDGMATYSGTGSDRGKLFSHVYGKAVELFGSTAFPEELLKENLP